MPIPITCKTKMVFIGDSITACNRWNDPDQMGTGFVRILRDYLLARDPANAPEVVNRGISGNRVTDLEQRWGTDVIDMAPDLLTVKIGINDVWHGLRPNPSGVPLDQFTTSYRRILSETRRHLPHCGIILCEPSVIWPPAPSEGNRALAPYVETVGRLGAEFGALAVIPLHRIFNEARAVRPEVVWAPDGVHPSSAGHMLIARAWLAATGLLTGPDSPGA